MALHQQEYKHHISVEYFSKTASNSSTVLWFSIKVQIYVDQFATTAANFITR